MSKRRPLGWSSVGRSETFRLLKAVISYLPPKQFRALWFLLLISTAVGIGDLVFVGLIAKLVGSFSGSSLADNLPFVRVFGGDVLDHRLVLGLLELLEVLVGPQLRQDAVRWVQPRLGSQAIVRA